MVEKKPTPSLDRFTLIGLCLLTAVLTAWLYFTPPGLLGKADAIGYAVCHRISARTFFLGERPLPLCARCSGMYLGALMVIIYQMRYRRKGGFPPRKILAVLAFFLVVFGVDGVNSYIHLMPNFPGLYDPNNLFRLFSGTGMGIGMGAMLMPVFHQSIWQNWDPSPAISRWRDFLMAGLLSFAASALLLSGNALLLYPLALVSAATVLFILGLIYTIVWVMTFKKDNAFNRISELIGYLALGYGTAILQILAIDVLRLLVTGTWNGFNFF